MTRLAQTAGLTDVQAEIISTVREFVDKEIIPNAQELEHSDAYPQHIVDKMKEMGLFGLMIPEEYGGSGLGLVAAATILETVHACGANADQNLSLSRIRAGRLDEAKRFAFLRRCDGAHKCFRRHGIPLSGVAGGLCDLPVMISRTLRPRFTNSSLGAARTYVEAKRRASNEL